MIRVSLTDIRCLCTSHRVARPPPGPPPTHLKGHVNFTGSELHLLQTTATRASTAHSTSRNQGQGRTRPTTQHSRRASLGTPNVDRSTNAFLSTAFRQERTLRASGNRFRPKTSGTPASMGTTMGLGDTGGAVALPPADGQRSSGEGGGGRPNTGARTSGTMSRTMQDQLQQVPLLRLLGGFGRGRSTRFSCYHPTISRW